MAKRRRSIRLICWKEDRARDLAQELKAAGFAVDAKEIDQLALRQLGHLDLGARDGRGGAG